MAVLQSTVAHVESEQDFEIAFSTPNAAGCSSLHARLPRALLSKIAASSRMWVTSIPP